MAKIIDYPRASLSNCISLARAIDELGGKCSIEMAAQKLDKKVSGAFVALTSAASKFDLVDSRKGTLSITDTYKNYKLAYNEQEQVACLREMFLHPPLFEQIAVRFSGQKLPIDFFDKLLIKEFGVQESYASRVAKYFIDGAKAAEILTPENVINYGSDIADKPKEVIDTTNVVPPATSQEQQTALSVAPTPPSGGYTVNISGPGIDSTITIAEEDDLVIVEAMLNKVKKKLTEMSADDE